MHGAPRRRGALSFTAQQLDDRRDVLLTQSGALRVDESSPRIVRITPSDPGGTTNPEPLFRVDAEKRGTGLKYDGIHLVLDQTELEMEFDPDRGWSVGRPAGPLSPGAHSGKAWAVDRAGNRSEDVPFILTVR